MDAKLCRTKASFLTGRFPAKGWTVSEDVPEELIGSTILFLGSEEDSAELVLDYRTVEGIEYRLILGFSERGMWIESKLPRPPIQDAA